MGREGLRTALVVALAAVVLAAGAGQARATIQPAVTLDGPSEEIVGFGGAAMAEDGTGGVVYLKRVDGVAHVFVSRYVVREGRGEWSAPIQVDTGQPYAASWPRIGAADDGRLVVVWATPFATEEGRPVDELLSATLGPGASTFGEAMIVDPDIRDGTGTSPALAMSSTGQADVVYRVVDFAPGKQVNIPLLRPGDVVEEVRVAHYDGERWSALGPVNRDLGVSMRPPTQANAPQLAIGQTGNAVVVWQEPEINGVARIWARRIFGSTLDYVLPVSAESLDGAPIEQDADAPSVAISKLGQAEVAYRQGVGGGSPLPGPRIFLNTLPDGESASGAEFLGASVADSQVSGGAGAQVGAPSIDVDEKRDMRLLYDSNGTPRVVEGDGQGLTGTLSLGPPWDGSGLLGASVMSPAGGGVSAWPSAEPGGAQAVAVREDFPGGAVQTALVSGGDGGEIGELAVGRSGLGDGLVAFQQGPLGDAAIVAAHVSVPPAQFVVSVPKGWIKPSAATISWLTAVSADEPLTYEVVLDGHPQTTPAGALSLRLNPGGLGNGHHTVQVLATDRDGQATLTPPAALLIDGEPPTVTVRRGRHAGEVVVRVRSDASGVATARVSFGDGHSGHGRKLFRHRYGRPGIYRIAVDVADNAGNRAVIRRLVSVG
jgi:PKD domain